MSFVSLLSQMKSCIGWVAQQKCMHWCCGANIYPSELIFSLQERITQMLAIRKDFLQLLMQLIHTSRNQSPTCTLLRQQQMKTIFLLTRTGTMGLSQTRTKPKPAIRKAASTATVPTWGWSGPALFPTHGDPSKYDITLQSEQTESCKTWRH